MPACICRVPFCRPPAPTGAVSLPACLPACLNIIPRAPAIVKSPVPQSLSHYITSPAPPQGRPALFPRFSGGHAGKTGTGKPGRESRGRKQARAGNAAGQEPLCPQARRVGNAGRREKRGGREAGDKQTAQREALCAVPYSDICPACPVAAGQEPPCPQARREAGIAGSAGSRELPGGGKRGKPGTRKRRRGKPLRRAVFRYMSGLPRCRRAGTGLPASPPGVLARAVTAAPRRAVCRRSARPARRGSAAPA